MSIYFDYISSIDQIAKDARSLQLIEPTNQLISPNILENEVIYVPREGLHISDVYDVAAVDHDASVIGSDGEDVVLIDAWGVAGLTAVEEVVASLMLATEVAGVTAITTAAGATVVEAGGTVVAAVSSTRDRYANVRPDLTQFRLIGLVVLLGIDKTPSHLSLAKPLSPFQSWIFMN